MYNIILYVSGKTFGDIIVWTLEMGSSLYTHNNVQRYQVRRVYTYTMYAGLLFYGDWCIPGRRGLRLKQNSPLGPTKRLHTKRAHTLGRVRRKVRGWRVGMREGMIDGPLVLLRVPAGQRLMRPTFRLFKTSTLSISYTGHIFHGPFPPADISRLKSIRRPFSSTSPPSPICETISGQTHAYAHSTA